MDLEPGNSVEIVSTPAIMRRAAAREKVAIQMELQRFPSLQELEGPDLKMRRPVRPVDRQRMRPWLMELLDLGDVFGLRWTNRQEGVFQISWKHASRLGWSLETDGDVFERWARHTGIYKEGDPPEPKRWKANFRCALHSLHDVAELTGAEDRKGHRACRTYKFLQSGINQIVSRNKPKTKKQRDIEAEELQKVLRKRWEESQQRLAQAQEEEAREAKVFESVSSDETTSEPESESSPEDRVIVQKVDNRSVLPDEDFLLHHDHDYSVGPERIQRTIFLRQGVGSVVLHKEVFPAEGDQMSNLDQLASAAMNSASLDAGLQFQSSTQASGFPEKKNVKLKESPKKAPMKLEVEDTISKLKTLLFASKPTLQDQYMKDSVKLKRRSSRSEADTPVEVAVDKTKESSATQQGKGGKRKSSESAERNAKAKKTKDSKYIVTSPDPHMTRGRLSSPMRTRAGSKTTKSDNTEPLMSSCLLLLEAATRLDKAEKKKEPGKSAAVVKGRKILQKSKEADAAASAGAGDQAPESEGEEVVLKMDVEDEDEDRPPEAHTEEEVQTDSVAVEEIGATEEQCESSSLELESGLSQGILRSTLEHYKVERLGKAEPTISSQGAAEQVSQYKTIAISDGKIMLQDATSDTAFPTGLFSGSKILPVSVLKSGKKKGKGKSSDRRYFVDIRTNPASAMTSEEVEEEPVVLGIKEVSAPESSVSTIRSNSGVQQTVIQRALPVLSLPTQKSASQSAESGSPIVIARRVTGGKGGPQIIMTTRQNSNQALVLPPAKGEEKVNVKLVCETAPPAATATASSSSSSQQKAVTTSHESNKELSTTVSGVASEASVSSTSTSASTGTIRVLPLDVPSLKSLPASSLLSGYAELGAHAKAAAIAGATVPTVPQPASAKRPKVSPDVKKKDILVFERETPKELKLHVVPVDAAPKGSTQIEGSSSPQGISTHQPLVQVTVPKKQVGKSGSKSPHQGIPEAYENNPTTPINVAAQVIFDPVKGVMLKLPGGPPLPLNNSIFQSQQDLLSQLQSSESSVKPVSPDPSTPTTAEKGQCVPVVLAGKNMALDSVQLFSILNSSQGDSVKVKTEVLPESSGENVELDNSVSGDVVVEVATSSNERDIQGAPTTTPQEVENQTLYISPQQIDEVNSAISSAQESVHLNVRTPVEAVEVEVKTEVSESPETETIIVSQEEFAKLQAEVNSKGMIKEEVTEAQEGGSVQQKAAVDSSSDQSVVTVKKEAGAGFVASNIPMDPTAPLAIGEIPLFAFSKGDSDGSSSNSD